jgi:hypothetical protein
MGVVGVYRGITTFLRLTNIVGFGICVFVEMEKEMIPFRMAKHSSETLDFFLYLYLLHLIFCGIGVVLEDMT